MNKGISRTDGQYLIFLNAGDKFHSPDTLATIARAIRGNDFPGIVYGQTNIVDNEGNTLGRRHLTAPEKLTLASFADGMLVCHQAFVALRRICGTYDLRYRFSADYDWTVRCLALTVPQRCVNLHRVAIHYLKDGLTGRNRRASLLERFRIMSRHYGAPTAIGRHVGFIPREIARKLGR